MPSASFVLQLAVAAGALVQPALGVSSVAHSTAKASSHPTKVSTAHASVGTATQASACASIGAIQKAYASKHNITTVRELPPFSATLAYDCLKSVPLNKTAAADFVKWYKPYLEFQSTIDWLKDPPSSYKQPATDLLGGIDTILSNINANKYGGEYEFELALSNLISSAHDGHLAMQLPLVNTFGYIAPWTFSSVSSDGVKLPEVFVAGDLVAAHKSSGKLSWTPSPVSKVNGQSALDYFTAEAKKSTGLLEPHADWNFLFSTGADEVANVNTHFLDTTIYPGSEALTLTFANGTTVSKKWVAESSIKLVGVKTGQDLYDLQVAPPTDDDSPSSSAAPNNTTTAKPKALKQWGGSYPAPVVVQPELGVTEGGFVTGYFLNKSLIAVLSIPSFEMVGESAKSFQETITLFLQKAKQAGMKKLIIDVQANGGGTIDLGFDLFKQLFPTLSPFSGSQFRATQAAKIFGTVIGSANETVRAQQKTNPYNYESEVDINNKPFSDFNSFFGPVQQHGGSFSNILRADFNDGDNEEASTGNGIVISGYANNSKIAPQYFDAKDVILLTDGFCASTCTIFAEELRTQAGVKRVVIGGRPETGPMQAVSGVRGAQILYVGQFQEFSAEAQAFVPTLNASDLPSIEDPSINTGDLDKWGINLRNQISQTDLSIPLQFVYQPADCRIFYTPKNLLDFSLLWQNAADAIWGNGTCVSGSTGVAPSSGSNGTSTGLPPTGTASVVPPGYSSPGGKGPGSSPPSIVSTTPSQPTTPSSSSSVATVPLGAGASTTVSMGALLAAVAAVAAAAL